MTNPWTNVYGVARTLLASGTLLTLLVNDDVALFAPAERSLSDTGVPFIRATLFGLLQNHLHLASFIAIGILVIAASGWRPRFTGIAHWWVTWSFHMTCIPADGGDQVATVLTLLLVPLTLTDRRRWHWDAPPPINSAGGALLSRIGVSSVAAVRLQAAVIYLHAAVGKFAVPEWVNGTALYYWLLDTRVGVPMQHHDLVLQLLGPAWITAALAWGTLALELGLFLALVMPADHFLRKPLLALGLLFHAGNILFFGLVSFFFSMTAALVLLVRPIQLPFSLLRLRRAITDAASQLNPLLIRASRLALGSTSAPRANERGAGH